MSVIPRRIKCLAAAVLLLFTTGCGSSDEVQSGGGDGGASLSFWCFNSFAQENSGDKPGTFEQSLIDGFEEQHPGIKIELTLIDFTKGPEKLENAIKNGSPPDILFDAPGRIISYAKRGKLSPLDDLFDEEFIKDVDNNSLTEACKAGDSYYMYPVSSAPFYMAFNKAYLEAAGVADKVKEGWTTDDFTEVLSALKREGYVPTSVYCKDQSGDQGTRAFASNLFSSGIYDPVSGLYTAGNEQGRKAFEYIYDISQKGYILNGINKTAADVLSDFAAGLSSYTLLWGPSQQKQYAETLRKNDVNVISVPYPSDDGVPELEYLINGFCVFDKNDDKRTADAKEFLRYCSGGKAGERVVLQTGCIPVRNSYNYLYTGDDLIARLAGWTKYYAPYYNTVDGFADMRVKWYTTLGGMLSGDIVPDKAAEEFERYANETLKKES